MKGLSLILVAIFTSACSSYHNAATPGAPRVAQAKLRSTLKPILAGVIKFEEKEGGLFMTGHVSGLKPNATLGFHIHEFGKCEGPDYKSAGGHLNPREEKHSSPQNEKRHLGDLGNLKSNHSGMATVELKVSDKGSDMDQILGKAVIIHEKADDFKTQPTGNSGGRIACGLIELNE